MKQLYSVLESVTYKSGQTEIIPHVVTADSPDQAAAYSKAYLEDQGVTVLPGEVIPLNIPSGGSFREGFCTGFVAMVRGIFNL